MGLLWCLRSRTHVSRPLHQQREEEPYEFPFRGIFKIEFPAAFLRYTYLKIYTVTAQETISLVSYRGIWKIEKRGRYNELDSDFELHWIGLEEIQCKMPWKMRGENQLLPSRMFSRIPTIAFFLATFIFIVKFRSECCPACVLGCHSSFCLVLFCTIRLLVTLINLSFLPKMGEREKEL